MSQSEETEMTYLRPGVEGWRVCVVGADGQIQEKTLDVPLAEFEAVLFVLPVEVFTICPLWIRSAEDSVLDNAVRLQLEKRNLLPDADGGRLIATRVVCREEGRALILATVLSASKLEKLGIDNVRADQFSISPFAFDMPSNAMVVWSELGRDIVAFTRDGEVVHFQALISTDDRNRAIELSCLVMQLEMEGVISPLEDIVLLDPDTKEQSGMIDGLYTRIGVRPRLVDEFPLKAVIETVDILPSAELRRRQLASKLSRRKKVLAFSIVAYVIFLLSMGTRLFWAQHEVALSRARQDFLTNEVAAVMKARELWQEVQVAVDPNEYPLEILALCVEAIPPSGVQLNEFGVDHAGKIILAGEAYSVPMALAFKSSLTSQESLSRYDWDFPQPRNRKNGEGAVFKATGSRNDYVTP